MPGRVEVRVDGRITEDFHPRRLVIMSSVITKLFGANRSADWGKTKGDGLYIYINDACYKDDVIALLIWNTC